MYPDLEQLLARTELCILNAKKEGRKDIPELEKELAYTPGDAYKADGAPCKLYSRQIPGFFVEVRVGTSEAKIEIYPLNGSPAPEPRLYPWEPRV